MADERRTIGLEVLGINDVKKALHDVPQKLRRKVLLGALKEAGKVIQAVARAKAPVLKKATKYRKPGTVKRAIAVRVSKAAKMNGDVGVFVGVRPLSSKKNRAAKRAQAASGSRIGGAYNPNDPYYWWFVEFGHKFVSRRGGQSGSGVTTYQQRLRDGRVVTRTRKYNNASITGRRHNSTIKVEGAAFMQKAAKSGNMQRAAGVFMKAVVPQINKLNNRVKSK